MTAARRKYVIFSVLAIVVFALDQVTKIWARGALGPTVNGKTLPVLGEKLYFRYAENPGVAFSMFRDLSGGRFILTLIAAAALVLVLYYLHKTDNGHTRLQAALGLVGGGAVGNLIDRAIYGHVTDFIWVDLNFKPFDPWPGFNIADAGLVVGVALMALDMFKPQPPSQNADKAAPPTA